MIWHVDPILCTSGAAVVIQVGDLRRTLSADEAAELGHALVAASVRAFESQHGIADSGECDGGFDLGPTLADATQVTRCEDRVLPIAAVMNRYTDAPRTAAERRRGLPSDLVVLR